MTVNYTTNLALGQPVTGTESGTWGDDVNNSVTSYLDIAIAGGLSVTVTVADVTLVLTQGTSSATNIGSTTAQYAILNVSGAMTAARNLILPSSSRQYVINNNTTGGFALTVKGSATSGVTMVNGEKAHVFWNGSDYAKAANTAGVATFTSLTLSDGTANGVAYLNGSKVLTTGSALTYDGASFGVSGTGSIIGLFTSSAAATTLALNNTNANVWGSNLAIRTGGVDAGYFGTIGSLLGSTSQDLAIYATASNGFRVYTNGNNERMRIDSSGNVGIGLTNPTYKLNVTSTSASAAFFQTTSAATWAANTSDTVFQAYNSTTTNNATALYGASVNYGDGTYTGVKFGAVASGAYSADFVVANRNGGTFQENVRITASGNVGLGAVPSAWAGKAFQIGNASNSGWASIGYDANGKGFFATSAFNYTGSAWKYTATGFAATLYSADSGAHKWFNAPSGTADGVITFTQAMTLDASGNLGIGTTVPTSGAGLTIGNDASGSATVKLSFTTSQAERGFISYNGGGGEMRISSGYSGYGGYTTFYTQGAEAARIDGSGYLLINTPTTVGGAARIGVLFAGNATNGINIQDSTTTSGAVFQQFSNSAGTQIGYIGRVTTTNAVVYSTASDYRLKEVIGPVSGAGARIDALQPLDYQWKDGNQHARGFLAHEFQEVYADSVTGTKDAVDADGNPKYQAMQAATSEVIADLVAEIQSLRKRLTALESKEIS